jgi:hypothetical protein
MPQIIPKFLLLATLIAPATSFQSPSPIRRTPTLLRAKQTYIYDGGELQSFLIHNANSISSPRDGLDVGCVTFITTAKQIGIVAPSPSENTELIDGQNVYIDTIAKIPKGISEQDAISTAAAALVGIHCGRVGMSVGGAVEEGFVGGKVSFSDVLLP